MNELYSAPFRSHISSRFEDSINVIVNTSTENVIFKRGLWKTEGFFYYPRPHYRNRMKGWNKIRETCYERIYNLINLCRIIWSFESRRERVLLFIKNLFLLTFAALEL